MVQAMNDVLAMCELLQAIASIFRRIINHESVPSTFHVRADVIYSFASNNYQHDRFTKPQDLYIFT